MYRPDLRWRQQRQGENNETSNRNETETGKDISILALLSGRLIVCLVGNHQRKESESDAPKQGVSETHTRERCDAQAVCRSMRIRGQRDITGQIASVDVRANTGCGLLKLA